MVQRSVAIVLAFLAVCLMVTAAQAADKPKVQRGTLVSVTSTKLVVNVKADKDDKVGMEKTFDVSPTVSVTINGAPGKIEDLKQTKAIRFTLDADGKAVVDIKQGKKPTA
ncbi:MAG TPA: hypothetical protein VGY55_00300 [Pirellulales bacterium]|jgi:hypothetical protein|nr:hypothetical protein [Pirellulales bacterium]